MVAITKWVMAILSLVVKTTGDGGHIVVVTSMAASLMPASEMTVPAMTGS
jgi:hypothetical protein